MNGYAFGGGLETAMSCDIRIASDNARFAAPTMMTGDPITAERAADWGQVSETVPQPDLVDRARAIAGVITSRAPIAAETAKLNLKAAFKEKRQPVFRRR